MANKSLIINSDLPVSQKVTGLLFCVAQEKKVEFTRAIQHTNLSLQQLDLLHYLDFGPKEGLTVNDLKDRMLDETSNVSRSLNKLVEAGYVVKQRSDVDQRIVYIVITKEGRKAHKEADKALLGAGLGLSEADAKKLYSILKKIE